MVLVNAIACVALGAAAGPAAASFACSVHPDGRTSLSARWWLGVGAPVWSIVVISALTGTASVAGASLALTWMTPAFWLLGVLAVPLAVVDIRSQRLPFVLTAPLWAVGCLGLAAQCLFRDDFDSVLRAGVLGVSVVILLFVLALALPGQLGLGDVCLAGVVALTLGWLGLTIAGVGLLSGLAIQALAGLFAIVRTGDRRVKLPCGPALLAGWFVAIAASAY